MVLVGVVDMVAVKFVAASGETTVHHHPENGRTMKIRRTRMRAGKMQIMGKMKTADSRTQLTYSWNLMNMHLVKSTKILARLLEQIIQNFGQPSGMIIYRVAKTQAHIEKLAI
jgi:hypothetical protein